MKRLLITALSLLLVFNGAGYQVINATEVDTQGEEISETSLPTEEIDGSTEENDDAVNDTTIDGTKVDNTEDSVQDSDSIDNGEEQIATVSSETIQYLDKVKFRNSLSNKVTDL